jgi:pyrroloquinoline quinone (PQQ) biosynthesis protein C
MAQMKTIEMILMESHPNGIFNEQDVWEAIAEATGMDYSEIADGDLTEWL